MDIGDAVQRSTDRLKTQSQSNVLRSLDSNPDDAARAVELSKATGADPGFIYGNLDEFERQHEGNLAQQIVNNNPYLQSYVNKDPFNAYTSRGDWGRLDTFSRSLKAIHDHDPIRRAGEAFTKGFAEGFGDQPWGTWAAKAAEMKPFGPASWVAWTVLGLPIEGFGRALGGVVEGTRQAIVAGTGSKSLAADLSGMLEQHLMGLSGVHMGGPTPAAAATYRMLEVVRAAKPWLDKGKRLYEVPVGVHPAIDALKKELAGHDAKALDQAVGDAKATSTSEAAPEKLADFARLHTDGTVGIPANAIRKLYGDKEPAPEDGLFGWVPDLTERLRAAEEVGGDVEIPLAEYVAHVDKEVAKALRDDVRVRKGGLTVNEAKEVPGIEAYHGSPYEFDAFKSEAIGTGEGAQSYGHGLYFAEKRGVAESYQRVEGPDYSKKAANDPILGPKLDKLEKEWIEAEAEYQEANRQGDSAKISDAAVKANNAAAAFTKIQEQAAKQYPVESSLYKVSIRANKEHFLDWDKPFEEQSPHVQEILKKLGIDPSEMTEVTKQGRRFTEKSTGMDFYHSLQPERELTGGSGDKTYPIPYRDDVEASRLLKEAGIPGIKYLDQGSRGRYEIEQRVEKAKKAIADAEASPMEDAQRQEQTLNRLKSNLDREQFDLEHYQEPTHNLVVFDPSIITIVERNGQALASVRRAAGLEPKVVETKGEPPSGKPPKEPTEKPIAEPAAFGMSKDRYARYMKKIEQQAREDTAWLALQAEKQERLRQTAEWKANELETRKKVTEDLTNRPDFLIDKFFRDGIFFDAKMDIKPRIDPEFLTKEQQKAIPKGYLKKGGLNPDDIAPKFGYTTGDEMLEHMADFHAARGKQKVENFLDRLIDAEVERKMREEYGDLKLNIAEAAKDHALSLTQIDLLHEQTFDMAAKAGLEFTLKKGDMINAARDAFDKELASAHDRDKYIEQMGRIGRKIEEALLKDDFATAFKLSQLQFKGLIYARESAKLQKFKDRFENLSDGFKGKDYPKTVAPEYTNFIRQILVSLGAIPERLEWRLAEQIAAHPWPDLRAFVEAKDKTFAPIPVADFLQDPQIPRVGNLTTDMYRAMVNSLIALRKAGRDEKLFYREGEKMDLDNLITRMIDQLQTLGEKKAYWADQPSSKLIKAIKTGVVAHINVESMMTRLDRDNINGTFTQSVTRPMAEAANYEARLVRKFDRDLRKATRDVKDLDKRIDPNDVPFVDEDGDPVIGTRNGVLGVLQNVGNPSNMTKLAEGYGLEPKAILDWLYRHTTKEDWDRAQRIGDIFHELFHHVERLEMEMHGHLPQRIEVVPIETPFGTYRGWYNPVKFDPRLGKNETATRFGPESLIQANFFRAATPQKYLVPRTGYIGKVELNLNVVPMRMRQMIRDIAFRQPINEVSKIFYDKKFQKAMAEYYSDTARAELIPWLQDSANFANYNSEASMIANEAAGFLRQNVIGTLVGLNIHTVMKHGTTALVNSATQVGPARFLKTAASLFSQNEQTSQTNWRFAMEHSEELQRRIRNIAEYYQDNQLVQLGKSGLRESMLALGGKPVGFADLLSSVPTWLAAFDKAMEEGTTKGQAVFQADAMVRRAHGSAVITNLPSIMRSNQLGRWYTSLYGFFNHMFQKQYEMAWKMKDTWRGIKAGDLDAAKQHAGMLAWGLVSYVIVPAMIEEAVTPMFDKGHGLLTRAALSLTLGMTSSWVGIRDIAHSLSGHREPEAGLFSTFGRAYTEFANDTSKLSKLLRDPAAQGRWLNRLNQMVGMTTGLTFAPMGRAMEFSYRAARGLEHPKSPMDWARGLSGSTSTLLPRRHR